VALYEELFEKLFDEKPNGKPAKEESAEAVRDRLKRRLREFLGNREQAEVIRNRLKRAAEEFDRHHANVFAINMCLHAASSIILSNPENLKGTLQDIQTIDVLKEKDPTTVLTVSVLYYLVKNDWDSDPAALEQSYRNHLQTLRSGFDAINWLLGEQAMEVLGLSKSPPKIPVTGTVVQQPSPEQKQQIGQQ